MTTFLAAQSVDMSSLFHFPWIKADAVLTLDPRATVLTANNRVGDDVEFAGEFPPAGGGLIDYVTRVDPDGAHVARIVFDEPVDFSNVLLPLLRSTNGVAALFEGDDRIDGSNQGDRLHGGGGADTITGDSGDDHIRGDGGADVLRGGQGEDRFEYVAVSDSGVGAADLILGFHGQEGDLIDLFLIDADVNAAGDQAFTLADAFTGQAGELTVNRLPGVFRVEGDIDGDAVADFQILVMAGGTLGAAEFVL
jgi:hypothetical protein